MGIPCLRNYIVWCLFDMQAMGTFDVTEISELSRSAELPVWFQLGVLK
jgi:hypothetical protein